MARIILKKSATAGKVPLAADLQYGEVALNYQDGKLYFKNTSNSVQSISAGALGVDSAATIALIDSAYVQARQTPQAPTGVDSAATIALIDSAYVAARQNTFTKIAVSGQTTVEADGPSDTLTLEAGSNISITTTPASDTIRITANVTSAGTSQAYDFGTFSSPVEFTLDMGTF
jgi:hypothetical protein